MCTGFAWFLAAVYREAGPISEEASGKGWWHDFKQATLMFERHDLKGRRLPPEEDTRQVTWALRLACVFPIMFFIVDYSIWRRFN